MSLLSQIEQIRKLSIRLQQLNNDFSIERTDREKMIFNECGAHSLLAPILFPKNEHELHLINEVAVGNDPLTNKTIDNPPLFTAPQSTAELLHSLRNLEDRPTPVLIEFIQFLYLIHQIVAKIHFVCFGTSNPVNKQHHYHNINGRIPQYRQQLFRIQLHLLVLLNNTMTTCARLKSLKVYDHDDLLFDAQTALHQILHIANIRAPFSASTSHVGELFSIHPLPRIMNTDTLSSTTKTQVNFMGERLTTIIQQHVLPNTNASTLSNYLISSVFPTRLLWILSLAILESLFDSIWAITLATLPPPSHANTPAQTEQIKILKGSQVFIQSLSYTFQLRQLYPRRMLDVPLRFYSVVLRTDSLPLTKLIQQLDPITILEDSYTSLLIPLYKRGDKLHGEKWIEEFDPLCIDASLFYGNGYSSLISLLKFSTSIIMLFPQYKELALRFDPLMKIHISILKLLLLGLWIWTLPGAQACNPFSTHTHGLPSHIQPQLTPSLTTPLTSSHFRYITTIPMPVFYSSPFINTEQQLLWLQNACRLFASSIVSCTSRFQNSPPAYHAVMKPVAHMLFNDCYGPMVLQLFNRAKLSSVWLLMWLKSLQNCPTIKDIISRTSFYHYLHDYIQSTPQFRNSIETTLLSQHLYSMQDYEGFSPQGPCRSMSFFQSIFNHVSMMYHTVRLHSRFFHSHISHHNPRAAFIIKIARYLPRIAVLPQGKMKKIIINFFTKVCQQLQLTSEDVQRLYYQARESSSIIDHNITDQMIFAPRPEWLQENQNIQGQPHQPMFTSYLFNYSCIHLDLAHPIALQLDDILFITQPNEQGLIQYHDEQKQPHKKQKNKTRSIEETRMLELLRTALGQNAQRLGLNNDDIENRLGLSNDDIENRDDDFDREILNELSLLNPVAAHNLEQIMNSVDEIDDIDTNNKNGDNDENNKKQNMISNEDIIELKRIQTEQHQQQKDIDSKLLRERISRTYLTLLTKHESTLTYSTTIPPTLFKSGPKQLPVITKKLPHPLMPRPSAPHTVKLKESKAKKVIQWDINDPTHRFQYSEAITMIPLLALYGFSRSLSQLASIFPWEQVIDINDFRQLPLVVDDTRNPNYDQQIIKKSQLPRKDWSNWFEASHTVARTHFHFINSLHTFIFKPISILSSAPLAIGDLPHKFQNVIPPRPPNPPLPTITNMNDNTHSFLSSPTTSNVLSQLPHSNLSPFPTTTTTTSTTRTNYHNIHDDNDDYHSQFKSNSYIDQKFQSYQNSLKQRGDNGFLIDPETGHYHYLSRSFTTETKSNFRQGCQCEILEDIKQQSKSKTLLQRSTESSQSNTMNDNVTDNDQSIASTPLQSTPSNDSTTSITEANGLDTNTTSPSVDQAQQSSSSPSSSPSHSKTCSKCNRLPMTSSNLPLVSFSRGVDLVHLIPAEKDDGECKCIRFFKLPFYKEQVYHPIIKPYMYQIADYIQQHITTTSIEQPPSTINFELLTQSCKLPYPIQLSRAFYTLYIESLLCAMHGFAAASFATSSARHERHRFLQLRYLYIHHTAVSSQGKDRIGQLDGDLLYLPGPTTPPVEYDEYDDNYQSLLQCSQGENPKLSRQIALRSFKPPSTALPSSNNTRMTDFDEIPTPIPLAMEYASMVVQHTIELFIDLLLQEQCAPILDIIDLTYDYTTRSKVLQQKTIQKQDNIRSSYKNGNGSIINLLSTTTTGCVAKPQLPPPLFGPISTQPNTHNTHDQLQLTPQSLKSILNALAPSSTDNNNTTTTTMNDNDNNNDIELDQMISLLQETAPDNFLDAIKITDNGGLNILSQQKYTPSTHTQKHQAKFPHLPFYYQLTNWELAAMKQLFEFNGYYHSEALDINAPFGPKTSFIGTNYKFNDYGPSTTTTTTTTTTDTTTTTTTPTSTPDISLIDEPILSTTTTTTASSPTSSTELPLQLPHSLQSLQYFFESSIVQSSTLSAHLTPSPILKNLRKDQFIFYPQQIKQSLHCPQFCESAEFKVVSKEVVEDKKLPNEQPNAFYFNLGDGNRDIPDIYYYD